MRGNDRREERREERATFGARGNADRYQMREKMLSIGDDFWIEDESGRRAFKVNGKALRVRQTLVIEDANGAELMKIQDRPVHVREVMEVEDPTGATVATVKKAMVSPLRERFTSTWLAVGRWPRRATSPTTSSRSSPAAPRSPRSRRSGSGSATPTASRSPGENAPLILAIAVCIDQMAAG